MFMTRPPMRSKFKTLSRLALTDHTDVIFEEVGKLMQERYPEVELRFFRKESVSGMKPEMMEDMKKECDAVVTGLGD